MRLKEFIKSKAINKSPQQQRIDSMQKQKDNLGNQLKAERNRQKIAKAQQQISKVKFGNNY